MYHRIPSCPNSDKFSGTGPEISASIPESHSQANERSKHTGATHPPPHLNQYQQFPHRNTSFLRLTKYSVNWMILTYSYSLRSAQQFRLWKRNTIETSQLRCSECTIIKDLKLNSLSLQLSFNCRKSACRQLTGRWSLRRWQFTVAVTRDLGLDLLDTCMEARLR